MRHDQEPT